MATAKIKKGDTVKIIAGKDKGKEGKVLEVSNGKIIVENANMVSKHSKPNQSNPNGGINNLEAAIDSSNVMYLHKGQETRIGFKFIDGKNGPKKVRYAKSTGDVID